MDKVFPLTRSDKMALVKINVPSILGSNPPPPSEGEEVEAASGSEDEVIDGEAEETDATNSGSTTPPPTTPPPPPAPPHGNSNSGRSWKIPRNMRRIFYILLTLLCFWMLWSLAGTGDDSGEGAVSWVWMITKWIMGGAGIVALLIGASKFLGKYSVEDYSSSVPSFLRTKDFGSAVFGLAVLHILTALISLTTLREWYGIPKFWALNIAILAGIVLIQQKNGTAKNFAIAIWLVVAFFTVPALIGASVPGGDVDSAVNRLGDFLKEATRDSGSETSRSATPAITAGTIEMIVSAPPHGASEAVHLYDPSRMLSYGLKWDTMEPTTIFYFDQKGRCIGEDTWTPEKPRTTIPSQSVFSVRFRSETGDSVPVRCTLTPAR